MSVGLADPRQCADVARSLHVAGASRRAEVEHTSRGPSGRS